MNVEVGVAFAGHDMCPFQKRCVDGIAHDIVDSFHFLTVERTLRTFDRKCTARTEPTRFFESVRDQERGDTSFIQRRKNGAKPSSPLRSCSNRIAKFRDCGLFTFELHDLLNAECRLCDIGFICGHRNMQTRR